jgi:hypothetical protein
MRNFYGRGYIGLKSYGYVCNAVRIDRVKLWIVAFSLFLSPFWVQALDIEVTGPKQVEFDGQTLIFYDISSSPVQVVREYMAFRDLWTDGTELR